MQRFNKNVSSYIWLFIAITFFFSLTAATFSNGPTIIIDDTLSSCPQNGIDIYPNPSDDGLALHFTEGNYTLSITATNTNDEEVYTYSATTSENDTWLIPTNEWESGYYHFRLEGNKCTSTIDIWVE